MSKPGPLLADPRYWPMFATQFAGAFNDNLFKNALVILVTYGGYSLFGLDSGAVVALASALFILPFFLFSATGGQLADKYEKSALVRRIKLAEIGVMGLGATALLTQQLELLLVVLFLMGTQSAFFGPVKYGILPQLIDRDRLVGGNALVEMATYLAILGGTIAGGVIVNRSFGPVPGTAVVAIAVVLVAIIGWLTSRKVVECPPENPELVIQWDPIRPTIDILRLTMKNVVIWRSVLAITWFWGFGSAFLTLFAPYCSQVLGANEDVATLFLAAFSVGIGVGSALCARLSRRQLEIGLVPIGSIGMSLFTFDLFLLGQPWPVVPGGELLGLQAFFAHWQGWRIFADLLGIATSGGLFIVPLYTLVQERAEGSQRSRTIAGNNIVNSGFMVLVALALMAMQGAGLSVPTIFGVLAVTNALVALYIYTVVPEFLLRLLAWFFARVLYRVEVEGLDRVPLDRPAVLVANHVSFIDWLIIFGTVPVPTRFVMDKMFAEHWLWGPITRQAKVIPIASAKRDPALLARAMDTVSDELRAGWLVCIFPEGQITRDGELNPFRSGVEQIVARDPVEVVPMAISGLWGSLFSRKGGTAMRPKLPRRPFMGRIKLIIGEPVPAAQVQAADLQARVEALWDRGGRQ